MIHLQDKIDCNYFTYYESEASCYFWEECVEFSPSTCDECISGYGTCGSEINCVENQTSFFSSLAVITKTTKKSQLLISNPSFANASSVLTNKQKGKSIKRFETVTFQEH